MESGGCMEAGNSGSHTETEKEMVRKMMELGRDWLPPSVTSRNSHGF
jgi:hypothetical protein